MHAHRRVVLTRTPDDNAALRRALGPTAAEVLEQPCFALERVACAPAVREALVSGAYDGAVFVSRNAVEGLFADGPLPAPAHVLALGPSTAACLATHGWAARVPSRSRAEDAARELDALLPGVRRVLYVRGVEGLCVLQDALRGRGVEVDEVIVYRTVEAPLPPLPPHEGRTLVVLASPAAARHWQRQHPALDAEHLAIGLTTAAALREAGREVHVAAESSTEGLAAAIRDWVAA